MFSSCLVVSQETTWETDLSRAAQRSAITNKPLMLHFCADWCRDCRQLDTFVFTNPVLGRTIQENVIPVRVNVDEHGPLVKEHAITSIPMDVIITSDGRVLAKQLSPHLVDDYARMLSKLPAVMNELDSTKYGREQAVQNVLASAKVDTDPVINRNNFAAVRGSSINDRIGLDQIQQVSNEHRREMNSAFRKKGPQRIVNKTFDSSRESGAPSSPVGQDAPLAETLPHSQNQTVSNPFVSTSTSPASLPERGVRDINRAVALPPDRDQSQKTESPSESLIQAGGVFMQRALAVDSPNASLEPDRIEESQSDPPVTRSALGDDSEPFALFGQCPVSLRESSQWVDGDPNLGVRHRGRVFIFASQDAMLKFQSEPDLHSPVLVGFDPVLFHKTGMLVEGKAKHGMFMGSGPSQRVILFCSEATRAEFQKAPEVFLRTVQIAMGRGVPVDGIKWR